MSGQKIEGKMRSSLADLEFDDCITAASINLRRDEAHLGRSEPYLVR